MRTFLLGMAILGMATLLMARIPSITKKLKISYSIFFVVLGMVIYRVFNTLPLPSPLYQQEFSLHITELTVIIALMGTGLKIDRPFSLKTWKIPFKLIFITMLVSIIIVALLGFYALRWDLASALLLGAILAPTDPVLAADVRKVHPTIRNR